MILTLALIGKERRGIILMFLLPRFLKQVAWRFNQFYCSDATYSVILFSPTPHQYSVFKWHMFMSACSMSPVRGGSKQ